MSSWSLALDHVENTGCFVVVIKLLKIYKGENFLTSLSGRLSKKSVGAVYQAPRFESRYGKLFASFITHKKSKIYSYVYTYVYLLIQYLFCSVERNLHSRFFFSEKKQILFVVHFCND